MIIDKKIMKEIVHKYIHRFKSIKFKNFDFINVKIFT
jgi:hypothetical protein